MLDPLVRFDAAVAVQVGREVAVTHDDGAGELVVEASEKGAHALTLGSGARVAGIAGRIQSTLVADADGVLVVALAVGTHLP